MGRRDEVPLIEPEIVQCLMMTGAEVDETFGGVHVVGWHELPTGDTSRERRVILRVFMPGAVAHALVRKLSLLLNPRMH